MGFVNSMARLTGLEPATSGVTGRHSNQLSYNRLCSRPAMRRLACEGGSREARGARQAGKNRFFEGSAGTRL